MNNDLRRAIVDVICRAREGHIPSSFSIVDIIAHLYDEVLTYKPDLPDWPERDFFILSKGHGALALYVVMNKYGLLSAEELMKYSLPEGICGGHPEIGVPHVEASTGSLGHGFPTAVGVALGLRIQNKKNRVFVLLGDGECHEGTIWEAANVAANQHLGNLVAIVDWNKSASQLMPIDDLPSRWTAFGWDVRQIDGHQRDAISEAFSGIPHDSFRPTVIIADTVKGKGVSFLEGHGLWHHRVPNDAEYRQIMVELKDG
jgi:transketolase